jgi:Uncharacterized archaeal coiled-coil protein
MDRFADERDVLNNKVKELIKSLREMKSSKDELSNKAADLKVKKDKLSNEFRKEINERRSLRSSILRDKGKQIDLRKMKKEKDDLIRRQMTGVYNKKEEEEIVKRIRGMDKSVKDYEKESEKIALDDASYKKLDEEIKTNKDEIKKTQDEYQATVKEVITLRDNQNKIYEEMIETKGKADEIHEKYLQVQAELFKENQKLDELFNTIREYEKLILALKQRQSKEKRKGRENEAKAKAEEIYEKFKTGVSLSTEDILILQKAGFL